MHVTDLDVMVLALYVCVYQPTKHLSICIRISIYIVCMFVLSMYVHDLYVCQSCA